jgi:hypothetical protein
MQKFVIATMAAVLVVACGNDKFFIHLNPTDKETSSFFPELIKDFNTALGCEAWSLNAEQLTLSNGKENLVIERQKVSIIKNTAWTKYFCDNSKAWGCFDLETFNIYYRNWIDYGEYNSDSNLKQILLHEIGHSMGLDHEEGTVMNEKYKFMPYPESMQSLVALINKHKKNQCWQINKD